jgi:hypothetical protein
MPLEQLLGTWDLTMQHSALAEPVIGRHVYSRVLDGAFVRLDWTYEHPDFPDATAMLSETGMHYFDVRGVVRVFDLGWTESGYTMVHLEPDFSQRFTALFDSPDAMSTLGDYSEDRGVTWHPDFTTTMQRVD